MVIQVFFVKLWLENIGTQFPKIGSDFLLKNILKYYIIVNVREVIRMIKRLLKVLHAIGYANVKML